MLLIFAKELILNKLKMETEMTLNNFKPMMNNNLIKKIGITLLIISILLFYAFTITILFL